MVVWIINTSWLPAARAIFAQDEQGAKVRRQEMAKLLPIIAV